MTLVRFIWVLAFIIMAGCSSKDNSKGFEVSKTQNIINGTEVTRLDPIAKHVVLIHIYEKLKNEDPKPQTVTMCTGVIVAHKSILTAAHCFDFKDKSKGKYVEVYYTQSANVTDQSLRGGARRIESHPHYFDVAEGSRHFDIAILKLIDPVPKGFEPIAFLPIEAELKVNDLVIAAGFGKKTNLPRETNSKLNKSANLKIVEDWGTHFLVDQSAGSGICQGDSGGPTFFQWKGKMYLAGINHGVFATGPDDTDVNCSKRGAMVKIQTHKAWIQQNLEN